MLVEVFKKGSNYTELYNNIWEVQSITRDDNRFIVKQSNGTTHSMDTSKVDLRVTY